jgi:hypothetical protein
MNSEFLHKILNTLHKIPKALNRIQKALYRKPKADFFIFIACPLWVTVISGSEEH